jgi:hypothetical protein
MTERSTWIYLWIKTKRFSSRSTSDSNRATLTASVATRAWSSLSSSRTFFVLLGDNGESATNAGAGMDFLVWLAVAVLTVYGILSAVIFVGAIVMNLIYPDK